MKKFLHTLHKGVPLNNVPSLLRAKIEAWVESGYINQDSDTLTLNSRYRVGKLNLLPNGRGIVIPFEDTPVLHIDSKHIYIAHQEDIVLVQRLFGKGSRAMVIDVAEHAFTYSVGYLKMGENGLRLVNIKQEAPIKIGEFESLKPYKEGTLFQIDNRDNSVMKMLGNIKEPLIDETVSLALFNRSDEFSKAVLKEVNKFPEKIELIKYKSREDLTNLPFCTIDPNSAKDFDDAIYYDLQNSTLYVAIADVSSYVEEDSVLDAEALKRGFSIYFPNRSIPMLPRQLSENLCSLTPNVNRLALVCEMKLDTDSLEVTKERFYEAVIHSKQRFIYSEVDSLLLGEESPYSDEWGELIKNIYKLTSNLRKNRLKKGLDLQTEEVSISLNSDALLYSTSVEENSASHQLVEECMLLANIAAAEQFERGIFRIHEQPNEQKIAALYEELSGVGITTKELPSFKATVDAIQKEAKELNLVNEVNELIIRSQMQAHYGDINEGHFGLGFSRYTHFTSPIRRYSDLIVHRLIKSIALNDDKKVEQLQENIELTAHTLSRLERETAAVESDFKRRKYARWAQQQIGKSFNARVVSTHPHTQAYIHDKIKGALIMVKTDSSEVALFSALKIVIESVNIATGKIFGIVDETSRV